MNPLLLKPAILAAIAGGIILVSFSAGFAVEHWRQGGDIEKLRGDNSILSSTNSRCEADVRNARNAVRAMQAEAEERARLAEEAMKQAQPKVETRTKVITQIKQMPVVALDAQCEAIKQEQIEYVGWRHDL